MAYTHNERACLAQFLRHAIKADTDPLSPRVRRWRKLLAKIDAMPGETRGRAVLGVGVVVKEKERVSAPAQSLDGQKAAVFR